MNNLYRFLYQLLRLLRLAYRFSGSAAFFGKSPIVVNNREKCGLNDKTLITTRNKTRNPSTFSERKNVEENKIRIFVVASVHIHYAHLVEAFRPTILEPCQRKNSRNNWNKIARKKTRSLRFASYLLFERLLKRFLSEVISYLLIQREKEDRAERQKQIYVEVRYKSKKISDDTSCISNLYSVIF